MMKYMPVNWRAFGKVQKNAASKRVLLYTYLRSISKRNGELEYFERKDLDRNLFLDSFLWLEYFLDRTFWYLEKHGFYTKANYHGDKCMINYDVCDEGIYVADDFFDTMMSLCFMEDIVEGQKEFNEITREYEDAPATGLYIQVLLEVILASQKNQKMSCCDLIERLGYNRNNIETLQEAEEYLRIFRALGLIDWEVVRKSRYQLPMEETRRFSYAEKLTNDD